MVIHYIIFSFITVIIGFRDCCAIYILCLCEDILLYLGMRYLRNDYIVKKCIVNIKINVKKRVKEGTKE